MKVVDAPMFRAGIAAAGCAALVAVGGCNLALDPTTRSDSTQSPAIGNAEEALPSRSEFGPDALKLHSRSTLPRAFSVKTNQKVFFITIDDGWTQSDSVLRYVRSSQIPVTAFLTDAAIAGNYPYFKQLTSYGGSVQNHTMTHAWLTNSSTNLTHEICRAQQIYRNQFGSAPTMLRPPFGAGGYNSDPKAIRREIMRVASRCGLRNIVMWDAVGDGGKFSFIRGSLHRGDIVLLHFKPDLLGELQSLMAMAYAKGLTPAPLADYLK